MEEKKNNRPSASQILSLLVDLLADQHGVRVKYQIVRKEDEGFAKTEGGGVLA